MIDRLPGWLAWVRDPAHLHRVAVLARTPVFAGLPHRLLGRLATKLFEKAYAPGEAVFREGDPGRALFVVLDGEVEVLHETPGGEDRITTFRPATSFGELALIDDLPRSATARATMPTRLLILYRTHFEALHEGDRTLALLVTRNLLRLLAGYVRGMTAAHGLPPSPSPPPPPPPAGEPPVAAPTAPR